MIEERKGGHSEEAISGSGSISYEGDTTLLDRGIGLTRNESEEEGVYTRRYRWDEENRLKATIDSAGGTVDYRYDAEGMRTNKYSRQGESLYFNRMWLMSTDGYEFRRSENIYLGQQRIATRANKENDPSTSYERLNTYYYHADHLGSSNIVTDPDGEPYEHLEYTPFGETWIEKTSDAAQMLPYRFTGKELDRETGLYYYGARYLNPKSSRWVSADPAGEGLINPGRDGFSIIESNNWYSYTSNNPVKYVDPTGMWNVEFKIGLGFALKINFGANDDTFTFGFDAGVGLGGGLSLDLNEKEVSDESIGTQGRGTIEAGGDVFALDAQSKTEFTVNPDGSCKNTSEASVSATDPKTNITGEIKLDADGNVSTSTKAKENLEGGLEGWGFIGVGMETTIPIRERKEE